MLPNDLEQVEAELLLLDEMDKIELEDMELKHTLSEDEAEQMAQWGIAS